VGIFCILKWRFKAILQNSEKYYEEGGKRKPNIFTLFEEFINAEQCFP